MTRDKPVRTSQKIAIGIFTCLINSAAQAADGNEETRYCSDNKRKSSVVVAFKRIHPCPSTGESEGPCPGWSVDHIIPLAVGGCDAVINLQWLPNEIKSCAGTVCKDRWERKVYKKPETAN